MERTRRRKYKLGMEVPFAAEHVNWKEERIGEENIEKDEKYARVLKLMH